MHVAEVEADHKVDSSPLDGEDKGLKWVEDVRCYWSLHQAALKNTLTRHLQAKCRAAMASQIEPAGHSRAQMGQAHLNLLKGSVQACAY